MPGEGGLGMDKFSEYLSIKIGIIVAGVYVVLSKMYFVGLVATFVVATLISFVLWLAVWDFSAAKDMPAHKHRTIFVIHVAASVFPPALGVFYISTMGGGT